MVIKSKKQEKESIAVIKTGGKQYIVSNGDTLLVEKLANDDGKIVFDNVLLISQNGKTEIGMPKLEGKSIEATINGNVRAKKILVVKYKQKSRYLRRQGHRQIYSKVTISKV